MTYDPFAELGKQLGAFHGCPHHPPVDRRSTSPQEAAEWHTLFKETCTAKARDEHERWLAKNDLYYLLVHILDVPKLDNQWHHDRCKEYQDVHDGVIDISTRGAGKSVKKTFGLPIQKILNNPDITIGIFSHSRPIAKGFLRSIQQTFESHERLRHLFPDILWENPKAEAPTWSLDGGLTVKRKSVTRKEATLEAWGVVDGQPSSKHYDWLLYDDLQKQVESVEMVQKIDDEWQTSLGLGSTKPAHWTMTGVFYRGGSICESLIDRNAGLARIRPAVFEDDTSTIWTHAEVLATKQSVGPATWVCEYLMNPKKKGEGEGFQADWLRYHEGMDFRGSNIYLFVDPGMGKQAHGRAGKCAMGVLAYRADKKIYLIDGIAGAMNLQQRMTWVIAFARQYNPKHICYERFGLMCDTEAINIEVKKQGFPDLIFVECTAHIDKSERIQWLQAPWSRGEIILPKYMPKRFFNGEEVDFLTDFVNLEYMLWPATKRMDVLDMLAWSQWKGNQCVFPEAWDDPSVQRNTIDFEEGGPGSTWMAG